MMMEKPASLIQDNARTIRGLQKVKATLSSPFQIEWPSINPSTVTDILDKLKRVLEELQPYVSRIRVKKRSGKKKIPKVEGDAEEQRLRNCIRPHILVGINAITRCMEKGNLHLVLVCRSSTHLEVLTDHLKLLSATREIPVAALRGLEEVLSSVLNIRTIHAVGFKKMQNGQIPQKLTSLFNEVLDDIIQIVPPISVPWLIHKNADLNTAARNLVKSLFPSGEAKKSHHLVDSDRTVEFKEGSIEQTTKESQTMTPVKSGAMIGQMGQSHEYSSLKRKHQESDSEDEIQVKKGHVDHSSNFVPLNLRQVVQGEKKGKKKKKNSGQNLSDK